MYGPQHMTTNQNKTKSFITMLEHKILRIKNNNHLAYSKPSKYYKQ